MYSIPEPSWLMADSHRKKNDSLLVCPVTATHRPTLDVLLCASKTTSLSQRRFHSTLLQVNNRLRS